LKYGRRNVKKIVGVGFSRGRTVDFGNEAKNLERLYFLAGFAFGREDYPLTRRRQKFGGRRREKGTNRELRHSSDLET
jgi:hypothetical protein